MHIKDLPAFAGLNATQIENFIAATDPVALPAGERVFTRGQAGGHIYFLGRGKLRVHSGERELAVLRTPCVVGEIELLTEAPFAASVTVIEPCEGYAMADTSFRKRLEDGDPASLMVIYNVSKQLAARLAAMDEKLVEILERNGDVPGKDLQLFREKLFGEWS